MINTGAAKANSTATLPALHHNKRPAPRRWSQGCIRDGCRSRSPSDHGRESGSVHILSLLLAPPIPVTRPAAA
jgi:hypothetical protein